MSEIVTPKDPSKEKEEDKDYYYDSYKEFSWKFRLWLVAFGIGAPAALLSTSDAFKALKTDPNGKNYIYALFIGAGIQIILSWAHKWAMFWAHQKNHGHITEKSYRYSFASFITHADWIEVICDFLSAGLFLYAILGILRIVLN